MDTKSHFFPSSPPQHTTPQTLLLVDNFSGHKLSDVQRRMCVPDWLHIEFLPENTTSMIQPCDGGIIALVKRLYKRDFLSELIRRAAADPNLTTDSFVKSINVLYAAEHVAAAWAAVPPEVIGKVWGKTLGVGVQAPGGIDPNALAVATEREILDVAESLLRLSNVSSAVVPDAVAGWLALEDNMTETEREPMTIAEALEEVTGGKEGAQAEQDDEDEETRRITHLEALNASILLRDYLAQEGGSSEDKALLDCLKDQIYRRRVKGSKQSTMKDFFSE